MPNTHFTPPTERNKTVLSSRMGRCELAISSTVHYQLRTLSAAAVTFGSLKAIFVFRAVWTYNVTKFADNSLFWNRRVWGHFVLRFLRLLTVLRWKSRCVLQHRSGMRRCAPGVLIVSTATLHRGVRQ